MPITINGSGTITGLSVGGLPDGTVDTDSIADLAVTAAKATGVGYKVDVISTWKLDANQSNGNRTPMDEHWVLEASEDQGATVAEQSGGGITCSSGVFSFPKTGIYSIHGVWTFKVSGDSRWNNVYTQVSTNGGAGWDAVTNSSAGITQCESDNTYNNVSSYYVIDVTNISTHKVRFTFAASNGSTHCEGGGNENTSNVTFMRIADT
jgi:hypothetical protein